MSYYEKCKEIYAAYGIDTEAAIRRLESIPVSVHCWQGDDVIGFDGSDSLSGGIQTTGNYPGRARTPEELFADIERAFAFCTEMQNPLSGLGNDSICPAERNSICGDAQEFIFAFLCSHNAACFG